MVPPRPHGGGGGSITVRNTQNVNWSMNIPELADLVLRLGAEGLKRLQLSGVDIHTLGCILSLGEISPASIEYRTKLQKMRELQRAKTWWIHNTIQYGSGTSFVVDELLKTRAGENVLALMTATSSMLEGSDIEFFNLVYNKYDPGMQNTPSLSQLQRLREVCLPLVRAMDFKDQLAVIHMWLSSQFTAKGVSHLSLNQALPGTTTMVKLVEILKDICLQDSQQGSRLAFYGIHGAAWLILYAKSVLGLPVCIVSGSGQAVPFSGEFKAASILVFPQASGPVDVFRSIGNASNVIVLDCDDSRTLSTDWLLSCDENGVDFFALACHWDMRDRQEIGDLIFSIAAEYVERRAGVSEYPSLTHYHAQDMDTKIETLRQILHLLGLPEHFSRRKDWRTTSFQNFMVDGKQQIELNLRQFAAMLIQSPEKHNAYCSHPIIQPVEIRGNFSICVRCHLYDVVREISFVASTLVFSDWHMSLRKIASRRLATGGDNLAQDAYDFFLNVFADWNNEDMKSSPYVYRIEHVVLAKQLASICSGSSQSRDMIVSNQHKFQGLDMDGILMIDYRAIEQSLRPGPIFVLRDGEFALHGERRPLLIASLEHGSSSFGCEIEMMNELKPFDHFPDAELLLSASLQKDAIKLQYTFSFDGDTPDGEPMSLEVDVPVLALSRGLGSLYATPSCPHAYDTPLQVQKVQAGNGLLQKNHNASYGRDLDGNLWQIRDTLTCGLEEPSAAESTLQLQVSYLFPVHNNPLAQWASVALIWDKSKTWFETQTILVLQQQACLSCTRAFAAEILRSGSGMNRQDYCIISAR